MLNKYLKFTKRKPSASFLVLLIIFAGLFIYFSLQPALYSPDSYGYLRGDFKRFPGYVIFTRIFTFVFKDYFDVAVIAVQLLLGFFSVYIFLQKASNIFKLNIWLRAVLFSILIFPYFYPLSLANNITSEGLAYPFYLLTLAFTFDFLFRRQHKKIIHLSVCFALLTLTRGQFILAPLLFALIFLFQYKKETFKKPMLFYFLGLLLLPILVSNVNKTYNKLIYGHYVATPFNYVNSVTLPLYVAAEKDAAQIENEADRIIFLKSLHQIDTSGLRSNLVEGDAHDKYLVFHNNFPEICNQNIFVHGQVFYRNTDGVLNENAVKIEETCKRLFPILIKENFREYVSLYFAGVFHGFKSVFVFIFVLLVFFYSLWLCFKKFSVENAALLLFSLLILSNAALVAVACHSIIRYLFYNYALGFLLLFILFRKITANR